MTEPRFLRGLRHLADRYDIFVVDLWGTLHDGVKAYPGAVQALARLKGAGKRIALLSNAPRRRAQTAQIIDAVGIAAEHYDLLLTSGEATYIALRDRPDDWHRRLAGPCWLLGPSRDRGIIDGLDIEIRDSPAGAGFCVATGTRLPEERVEDYQRELDRALAAGLPMICANPDIVVPAGDALVVCAGAFAQYYVERGGDVYWHGKPHQPIYRRLFSELEALTGAPVDRERTIGIGDALPTDIAGAAGAGIASALLVGGIHRSELKPSWRGRPDRKALTALCERYQVRPDFVLPRFLW